MQTLESLNFINTFAQLPADFYALCQATPLPAPYLVSFNAAVAGLLDLAPAQGTRTDFPAYFCGNAMLPGAQPLAMLYSGHQFGHYAPQLGDGRALLLGEVQNAQQATWEIALKGSGPTPYSRGFDGRAVLRSSIREYLCSEAMHALGIPTTRALAIIGSDARVYRETAETAAVVTRLSPSFVRFGSFEVFFYRQQYAHTRQLAEYVIRRHFPDLAEDTRPIARLLYETGQRTARLIAQWQAVGFAHGVMNTDNMSILGLTLDYGPFGFMGAYDPHYVCNHSDTGGRYAFDRQPMIGLWNLQCLAQALLPHISQEEAIEALSAYQPAYEAAYLTRMRQKLGLRECQASDASLIAGLLQFMQANALDYTLFFRALGAFDSTPNAGNDALRDQCIDRAAFDAWAVQYRQRLLAEHSDDRARKAAMDQVNPKYILRNHLAEGAIRKAADERDYSEIDRLLKILQSPFDEQPAMAAYAALPPDWASRLVVSCSS